MTDECPLTELPPEQCACPNHRGGQVVEPDRVSLIGPPFEARYPGQCPACGRPIGSGDWIGPTEDERGEVGYVHVPGCSL